MRTVPIPTWVKTSVDAWTAAALITSGPVFRAINKAGRVWGDGMSPKVLWDVVRAAAGRAGIDKLALHDETVRDIVGLYLDPPAHAAVFCVDEKPQIQALDRTQPR
jgi:hypothetical protein